MTISRLLIPIGLGVGLSFLLLLGVRVQSGVASQIADGLALSPRLSELIVRYVAKSGVDQGECAVSADPCRTVQYAIDQAGTGDEVRVAVGVYTDINPYDGLAQVAYISKTLDLRGGYTLTNWIAPDYFNHLTVLDAQGLGRVVYITGSITTTLEGLRLTGGDSGGLGPSMPGGGAFVANATVTISGTEIMSNTSPDSGGGLFLAHSRAYLNQNAFRDNVAPFGGGIHGDSSIVWMSDNALIDNVANDNVGGGAFFKATQATLEINQIRSNHSAWAGGGVAFDEDSEATLISNTFQSNDSRHGGGLYTEETNASLISNNFNENTASYGGGSYFHTSDVFAQSNTYTDNDTSGDGGGIYSWYSTVSVEDNLFRNHDSDVGGGLYLYYSNVLLSGNTIISNTGYRMGGGAYLLDSPGTIERNVIAQNKAFTNWGGGAVLDGSSVTMTNNMIVDNQSDWSGSGLLFDRVDEARLSQNTIARNGGGFGDGVFLASDTHITLTNTILVGQDIGIYVSGGINDSSAHLEGTLWGSGIWANGTDWAGDGEIVTGTVNIWGNPGFLDPDSGDYHLGFRSAAIDAGVDSGIPTDIDGETRPAGAGYDIGADEFTGTRIKLFLPILMR